MASLSIVIPTFNSATPLGRCLASVHNPGIQDVEVIVVDDVATTDTTRDIALSYGARVIVSPAGMAESRNEGIADSAAPYILSVDSDMVLSPGLLRDVFEAFSQGLEALTIREVAAGGGYWVRARAIDKETVEATGLGRAVRGFTRALFERVGGFDPTLEAGEDLDFHRRVLASGAKVGHISGTYFLHDEGRLSLAASCRKKFRYGITAARFEAKHGLGLGRSLGFGRRLAHGTLLGCRKDPLAVPGFLVLKSAEAIAGLAGRLAAKTKGSPSQRSAAARRAT